MEYDRRKSRRMAPRKTGIIIQNRCRVHTTSLFVTEFSFIFDIMSMHTLNHIITETLTKLYPTVSFSPEITIAPKPELGEYCINIFPLAKPLEKAPNTIALEVTEALEKYDDVFRGVNAAG